MNLYVIFNLRQNCKKIRLEIFFFFKKFFFFNILLNIFILKGSNGKWGNMGEMTMTFKLNNKNKKDNDYNNQNRNRRSASKNFFRGLN